MKRYYDRIKGRIIWVDKAASPEFWDVQWSKESDIEKKAQSAAEFVAITKKFLPETGSRILEGGCGNGGVVLALQRAGYKTVGVDYAQNTVSHLNENFSELDIRYGDVRNLESIESQSFAGYWSLGVIEHFWSGYGDIVLEMNRVLVPGGFLFLTFPWVSPVRKFKAAIGNIPQYSMETDDSEPEGFYQFSLPHKKIVSDIESQGFQVVYHRPRSGYNGLKTEFPHLYKCALEVKSVLNQKRNRSKSMVESETTVPKLSPYTQSINERLLSAVTGHGYLIVAQKTDILLR